MESTVDGNRIRALRHAREIVDDMRWRGMAVPSVYASMAEEFAALVRSGEYAAWLAGPARPRRRATGQRTVLRKTTSAVVRTGGADRAGVVGST
jgi:hypothetical protein